LLGFGTESETTGTNFGIRYHWQPTSLITHLDVQEMAMLF